MRSPSRIVFGVVLVALASLAGCRWPWEPEAPSLSGTVRYPDGGRANVAKVYVLNDAATFTDWTGRYSLQLSSAEGDTVTVYATDFCRGTCTGSNWGFTKVVLRGGRVTVDLVLDRENDI